MALASLAITDNEVGVVAIITLFVIFPIAIGIARWFWRRGAEPPSSRLSDDTARRLMHMQQSIDTMAVEIERISEGQRFVTRLLGEKASAENRLNPP